MCLALDWRTFGKKGQNMAHFHGFTGGKGGGSYAKSLKNIIAFGPEMPVIDYRIHGADEFILESGMEEAVLIYMEAIKNLLAI